MSPNVEYTDEKIIEDVAVWITIGQSNADGSAIADETEDANLKSWYESYSGDNLRIWYRASETNRQSDGSFLVFDGSVEDAEPGWMKLWYKNDNRAGRTSMNIISQSWSTDDSYWSAAGRRGMEGAFGRTFVDSLPDKKLYIIKLGVSGSSIDSWADEMNNHNWDYFYNKIYRPAMNNILDSGKRPCLAGIWWMQGCADEGRSKEYYTTRLARLVDKLRNDTGFRDAPIYIGEIQAPEENSESPFGSKRYSKTIRESQNEVAELYDNVSVISTSTYPLQSDSVHFSHKGIDMIGHDLALRAINSIDSWSHFSTPGEWNKLNTSHPEFIPLLGSPSITVKVKNDSAFATLTYPGFTETKSSALTY